MRHQKQYANLVVNRLGKANVKPGAQKRIDKIDDYLRDPMGELSLKDRALKKFLTDKGTKGTKYGAEVDRRTNQRDKLKSERDTLRSQVSNKESRLQSQIGNARQTLEGLVGVTGKGGSIAEVRETLFDLRNPQPTDPSADEGTLAGFRIEDILAIAEATRYNVFDSLPRAHKGARVVGPTGSEAAVVAQAGEVIGQPGGVNVTVEVANGMEWLKDYIDVRVEKNDRNNHQRLRAGVR
jgi:hypothetical protein